MDETIVAFGGSIKALGDGKIGGYLVRYTDADAPDLDGDFFTMQTEFDADDGDPVTLYYNHGLDPILKKRRLGRGHLRFDEVGAWVEAQLEMRDDYERAIYRMAESGKLGWSSGTLPNLVEREPVGKAWHIKSWPLGKDASLTPTPAAGPVLTAVQPLKTWAEATQHFAMDDAPEVPADEPETVTTGDTTPADIEVEAEVKTAEAMPEDAPASVSAIVDGQTDADASDDNQTVETVSVEDTMENEVKAESTVDNSAAILDALKGITARIDSIEAKAVNPEPIQVKAPAVIVNRKPDTEESAFLHWIRTDDRGAAKSLKASNDTDMNVGTPADGGYAVPTGHYQGIIARLDESALYGPLGVMMIPGQGTTVNVPLDNEADGEFVSTNENSAFDRDAPALSTAAMTLVKYTKKVEMSYELLQDEDSRLQAFLDDFVGRGMAKTMNSLMLTEALANGTAALTLDSASAIGAAEIPELMYKVSAEYAAGGAWIMKRATEGYIRGLSGNNFQFVPTPAGNAAGRELFGAPIYNSEYVGSLTASGKSLVFGNFRYMGMRLAPEITVLRDPFSRAAYGQVVLHYYFRTVFKVLQAEAIAYATHPTA